MADPSRLRHIPDRPRVFIVSDISNEPDDAQSLVRLLLYANELHIRGLVACTSCWMRSKVHPEDMRSIVGAYGEVVENLNEHVHPDNQYPSAEELMDMIKSGPEVYGRMALEEGYPLSEGAELLIQRVDESDDLLWILSWGGINVLAQALKYVHETRTEGEGKRFREKLRVYTISDQDDCGAWIRVTYPDIFYICSLHAWGEYGCATWTGISGDLLGPMDKGGPDTSLVSKEWLRGNIQTIGSRLGGKYPDASFIMEGDTPTFLYLVQNGLGVPEEPGWGSWGGRYGLNDLGGASRHFADVCDAVKGMDGTVKRSGKATIWRWRREYQNDFAARMRWTLGKDRTKVNHAPVVVVNDSTSGPEPYSIEIEAGEEVVLDASRSYDPDPEDELVFEWYHYKEPTTTGSLVHWPSVPDVEFVVVEGENGKAKGSIVKVRIPEPEKCAVNILTGQPMAKGQKLHFILSARDNGVPTMTTYKRVVVQVTNSQGRGGSGKKYDTVTEALGHSTGQETLSAQ